MIPIRAKHKYSLVSLAKTSFYKWYLLMAWYLVYQMILGHFQITRSMPGIYDILKHIFFNESAWILIKITLKFVRKGPANNIAALVQIIAWHRPGDKPLFEPVMVSSPTHIRVNRPQRIYNAYSQTVAYWNVLCLCPNNSIFKMKTGSFISLPSLRCSSAPSHQPGHFVKKMFPWCRAVTVFLCSG